MYSVSLLRVQQCWHATSVHCHLRKEASPLLFALPGRKRMVPKTLCSPSQPQTASVLTQLLNKDWLAAPTHLHCSWCSQKSWLDWNDRGSSNFPRNETGNALYIQARGTVKHVLPCFLFPLSPPLCLGWSSCTKISLESFPVFSLKIPRTDVAVSWVIFKFPREKRGERVKTCFFRWGRGTSEGEIVLSTAWIVYTESFLLIISWHYILFF